MKKYNFTVIIEKDTETGLFVGEVPGFAGCHSQGETINELMINMKEVIQLCLEAHKQEAAQLPKFVGLQQIEISVN